LENVGVIVAPEARYRQALIFVPRDDDFPMEFAYIRIGKIDGNYKSIPNQRSHRVPANAQATRERRIGTPVYWRSDHALDGCLSEQWQVIAPFAVSRDRNFQ
jgi:hypothetical protein